MPAENPRWTQYKRSLGYTSEEQALAEERKKHPGGIMCGFMLWNSAKLREFLATVTKEDCVHVRIARVDACITSIPPDDIRAVVDGHSKYNEWLAKNVTEVLEKQA